jgi:ceramide glucosyltransferase
MTLTLGAAVAASFIIVMLGLHLASIALVTRRCRKDGAHLAPWAGLPPVTVVRPVCGLDNFVTETLGTSFTLDYPEYEVIFCVAREDDPVAPLVRRLIAAHPQVPARLLIGENRASSNPKLNNVVKGWDAARHPWIILADSNVLMPRDYIQRLMARWQPDETGLVCSPPLGSRPANFWAELECAFLNTFQARWQYAGETAGFGFAQGKTMLFRRDVVEQGGGIRALGAELAEDAATTKLVRNAGLSVHLVDNPFEQPLGHRTAAEIWLRQLRWARLRRITFPLYFMPELFVGAFFPSLAAAYLALQMGWSVPGLIAALLIVWYGAEAVLARAGRWHLSPWMPLAWILRDIMLPALWVDAWMGDDFTWRGTGMNVHVNTREETEPVTEAG